jgi:hypothetical protein
MYPEMELLNDTVVVLLIFLGIPIPLSTAAHHFTFCQQCLKVLLSPYPHQHLFFLNNTLITMKKYLGIVLNCIFLLISDVAQCLLAICVSLEKYSNLCPFLNWVVLVFCS